MIDSFHPSDKITSDTGTDNEMKDKDPQDNDADEEMPKSKHNNTFKANENYDDLLQNLESIDQSNGTFFTRSSERHPDIFYYLIEPVLDEDMNPEVHNQNLPLRDEEIKENIYEDEEEESKLPYKRPCSSKNDSSTKGPSKNVPYNKSPNKEDTSKKKFKFAKLSFEGSKFKLEELLLENSMLNMKIDGSNSSITDSGIKEIPKTFKENFETFFNSKNDKKEKYILELSPFLEKFMEVTLSVEYDKENSLIKFHLECDQPSISTIFSKIYFGSIEFIWLKSSKTIKVNLIKPKNLELNSKKAFFRFIKQVVNPETIFHVLVFSSDIQYQEKSKRNTKIKSKTTDENIIDSIRLNLERDGLLPNELKSIFSFKSSEFLPTKDFLDNLQPYDDVIRNITMQLLNSEHQETLVKKFEKANQITFSKIPTNQEFLKILNQENYFPKKITN